ncbi:hypothetical protein H8959_011156 [Pygathrix nigripes]
MELFSLLEPPRSPRASPSKGSQPEVCTVQEGAVLVLTHPASKRAAPAGKRPLLGTGSLLSGAYILVSTSGQGRFGFGGPGELPGAPHPGCTLTQLAPGVDSALRVPVAVVTTAPNCAGHKQLVISSIRPDGPPPHQAIPGLCSATAALAVLLPLAGPWCFRLNQGSLSQMTGIHPSQQLGQWSPRDPAGTLDHTQPRDQCSPRGASKGGDKGAAGLGCSVEKGDWKPQSHLQAKAGSQAEEECLLWGGQECQSLEGPQREKFTQSELAVPNSTNEEPQAVTTLRSPHDAAINALN